MNEIFPPHGFWQFQHFFGGVRLLPFQGGCQGNKGAPAMWLVVSTGLVHLTHTRGFVSQIKAAMSSMGVEFAGFLFVDDTDLITLASLKSETANQVFVCIQEAVCSWHGGLLASGGALKPEKCSWCLANYSFQAGQWSFTRLEDTPFDLVAPDLQGVPTTIECLDPSKGVKVVGVHQSLDGKMTTQVAALKAKADSWGGIKHGWLPRNLAHQRRDSMIWASLQYPLPPCTITE
jgi:hypothetical protein